ncbi:MAG TPA: glycosyltransferase, partial [Gaiellaceae bacterium]|nr:glycosyltransferase [Gaiellaceae bacterium]
MAGVPWLILPTYEEAPNVEHVVARVLAALRPALGPGGFRVLVVDDASPDGTGAIADRLAAEHAELQVLHRTGPRGLAHAYLAGFRVALDGGASEVWEMDADGSHDPADLPRLLGAVREGGAGLALGSRYVPGGDVAGWGVLRRVVSRGGSAYARLVLGVGVRDL